MVPASSLERTVFLLAIVAVLIATPSDARGCQAGVCDGTVTSDGRPICWKLRVQVDVPNDVRYFPAGVEHHAGLGPAIYSYLGTGPHDDGLTGPARGGVNARGLAIGFNAFNGGDWEELHHYALGFAFATAQVDTYLLNMTNLGTIHYYTDAKGHATLWENDLDPSDHWEYNTQAAARAEVFRDFDGDQDEISYAGWVGRANTIDMFTDGMDSLRYGEDDRTAAAQTVPGRLVDGDAMNVPDLAVEYFRHDVLARDATVSSMIVHGVLPAEDVRLTTMWIALGHAEAAVFVPVWIHGVESGGADEVPPHLDHGGGECVYIPAKGLINDGADESAVQARTLPVESHFFDVVIDELLPEWRLRDWSDDAIVAAIGREMKRVQEQMDADAYSLLNCLYLDGVDNHAPLGSGIDGWSVDHLTVNLAATAIDGDGTVIESLWNYGDGETGTSDIHDYEDPGTYLVSFTVTDDDSVSHTDWEFVTVPDPLTATDEAAAVTDALVLNRCFPNPFNPRTSIRWTLPAAGLVQLDIYDARGRHVRTLAAGWRGAGHHEIAWDGCDRDGRSVASGVYQVVLRAASGTARQKLTLLK